MRDDVIAFAQRVQDDSRFRDGFANPIFNYLERLMNARGMKITFDALIGEVLNCRNILTAADALFSIDATNFQLLTPKGDLIKTQQAYLMGGKGEEGQIVGTFGDVICPVSIEPLSSSNVAEDRYKLVQELRGIVLKYLLQYVRTHRQALSKRALVDMYAANDELRFNDREVQHIMRFHIFKPDADAIEHAEAVREDFTEHFSEFDDFLSVVCAARFAPDRRQAFIWLHAPKGWGKTLLLSALANLRLVTEISAKEIEACIEGSPVGLDPDSVARSWVLACDEARVVKAEFKQLNREIMLTPKYCLKTTAPVYTKLFISAESLDSLTGESGVEAQFADRFMYLRGTGRIEDRALFKRLGSKLYLDALTAFVGQRINDYVLDMRALHHKEGEHAVAKLAHSELMALHAKYKITNFHASLEDTVVSMAEELRQLLLDYGRHRRMAGPVPDSIAALTKAQEQRLRGSFGSGYLGADRTPVHYLKQPVAFTREWLEGRVSRSEAVKISYKAKEMVESLSVVPIGTAAGVYHSSSDASRDVFKALFICNTDDAARAQSNVIPFAKTKSDEVSFF